MQVFSGKTVSMDFHHLELIHICVCLNNVPSSIIHGPSQFVHPYSAMELYILHCEYTFNIGQRSSNRLKRIKIYIFITGRPRIFRPPRMCVTLQTRALSHIQAVLKDECLAFLSLLNSVTLWDNYHAMLKAMEASRQLASDAMGYFRGWQTATTQTGLPLPPIRPYQLTFAILVFSVLLSRFLHSFVIKWYLH